MKRMCGRPAGRLAASREAWTWEKVGGGEGYDPEQTQTQNDKSLR